MTDFIVKFCDDRLLFRGRPGRALILGFLFFLARFWLVFGSVWPRAIFAREQGAHGEPTGVHTPFREFNSVFNFALLSARARFNLK